MGAFDFLFGTYPAHMWLVFLIIAGMVASYVLDRIPMELTSLFGLVVFLVLFSLFPLRDEAGQMMLSPEGLLSGFANPALFAVLALLVVGQGLFQTGALEGPARYLAEKGKSTPVLVFLGIFVAAAVMSAFLNNTPVVVMFIPFVSAMASRFGHSLSRVMMPLSFVCILGGMTTLIGSSTNLLVSGAVVKSGLPAIGFFDFAIPGLFLAAVGGLYCLFIMPRLIRDKAGLADQVTGTEGRHYIVQIGITGQHSLLGETAVAGQFPSLKDMTVQMIQRGTNVILPPFEDVALAEGDVVLIATTRGALTSVLSTDQDFLQGADTGEGKVLDVLAAAEETTGGSGPGALFRLEDSEQLMAEAMVAPGSRMNGRTIEQIAFQQQTGCVVLGLQRRSRMFRAALMDIQLEPGDVLLVMGLRERMERLRRNRDVLLLEWSTVEMPDLSLANRARVIFALVALSAALGIFPIAISALAGAALMLATGCLNIRQTLRAFDERIYVLVGTALAMSTALEATGGAAFLAQSVVTLFAGAGPIAVLSALFLVVALMTNLLSNNATAVLFTPIAISTANTLGLDPVPFIYTVIFAANCSFATPIGYQTNLLVMGPGHYSFSDYLRAGTPLVILLWISYTLFASWYYVF